jgi:hypothetical protein
MTMMRIGPKAELLSIADLNRSKPGILCFVITGKRLETRSSFLQPTQIILLEFNLTAAVANLNLD